MNLVVPLDFLKGGPTSHGVDSSTPSTHRFQQRREEEEEDRSRRRQKCKINEDGMLTNFPVSPLALARPLYMTRFPPISSSTGSSKPLPAVHRSRRSMSTDSADSTGRRAEAIDTISARLHNVSLVPVQQKVGSKHADVIDAWDGTGIGLAKWHHAGPYDAAAPSRNKQVTGGGGSAGSRSGGGGGGGHHDTRAPMAAFGSSERVPQVPTKGGADSPGSAPSDVLDGLVPELPSSKPMTSPPAAATSPSSKLSQRAQAALRQRGGMGGLGQTSPGYGSLQDPYSSSLPSSGGYFVAASVGAAAAAEGGANGAGGLSSSGSTNALAWDEQEERRRRKEEKKRALKAAWGIDERECAH